MATADSARVERFKQRVGFDAAIALQDKNEAIVAEWPDFMLTPPMADSGPGWATPKRKIFCAESGCSLQWIARRNDEKIKLTIFVAGSSASAAVEMMLRRASASMMVEIPAVRGPRDLGALSLVIGPLEVAGTVGDAMLMWVDRNVCIELELFQSALDPLAFARVVDAVARRHVVSMATWLSRRPALPVAPGWQFPARAKVGSDVAFVAPAPAVLQLGEGAAMTNVEVVALRGGEMVVRGVTAGPGRLLAHLVDEKTLVSRAVDVRFEFGQ